MQPLAHLAKTRRWRRERCQQWCGASGAPPSVLLAALLASKRLAAGSRYGEDAVAAGALPVLIPLLSSSNQDVQAGAACALAYVCHSASEEHHRAAAAAEGAIPALVSCLGSTCDDIRFWAACTLYWLCLDSPQRSCLALLAGAVPAVECCRESRSDNVSKAARDLLKAMHAALSGEPAASPSVASTGSQHAAAADTPSSPAAPRVCANPGCGATRGLRRCSACRTVLYCSEACSRTHWREHKAECRRVQLQAEQASTEGKL